MKRGRRRRKNLYVLFFICKPVRMDSCYYINTNKFKGTLYTVDFSTVLSCDKGIAYDVGIERQNGYR